MPLLLYHTQEGTTSMPKGYLIKGRHVRSVLGRYVGKRYMYVVKR